MEPVLLELKQERPGFQRFIGSWLLQGRHNILVDVGPSHSIDQLVSALKDRDMERVDYVLLTHIHIDHAGGLGRFLTHFPEAKVICHEKGIGHLVNPVKLEAASRKVLGTLVDMYGPFRPVSRDTFIPHGKAKVDGLTVIETPGHAAHHLSYVYGGHLFAGEASGIFLDIQGIPYTRPATPPVFNLEEFLASIDRLMDLGEQPICYAHYGMARSSHDFLKRAKGQLLLWKEVIEQALRKTEKPLPPSCIQELLMKDPCLEAFDRMGPGEREREILFMTNCIQGYIGYLSPRA